MKDTFQIIPDAASDSAWQVDYISLTLFGITVLFAGGIAIAIVAFVAKYWHTRDVNRVSTGSHRQHMIIEVIWSIGPLIILMVMFVWGAAVYINEHRPPKDAIDIYIVAKQWMWKVAHQSGRREINSLHVPIGRPVRLTMISEDVVHSFFVPAFRTKRDVIPGRYSTFWFQPTKLGVYHLFCAEYCGTDHSRMIGEVVVQTPEEYAHWLAEEQTESLAERGRRQFTALGCLQCHGRAQGVQAGPPLTGLYGRTVALNNGTTVLADEAYIRRSIIDPKSQVRAGFAALMPSYDGKIEPDQVLEITAYLRSIADVSGPLAGPGIESTGPLPGALGEALESNVSERPTRFDAPIQSSEATPDGESSPPTESNSPTESNPAAEAKPNGAAKPDSEPAVANESADGDAADKKAESEPATLDETTN